MLSFEQKRGIFSSFDELIETNISYDRVNYEYPETQKRRRVIIRELHPNGNGYVCGEYLHGYNVDPRGWINIKDFTEGQLRAVVREAIDSFSRP